MSPTPPALGASSKKDGVSQTSSSKDKVTAFLEQVRDTIETHRMIAAGDLVVVAVSGGSDSTALLHALVQIKGRHRFRLRVAHVHHGIRGVDADTDARAAAAFQPVSSTG